MSLLYVIFIVFLLLNLFILATILLIHISNLIADYVILKTKENSNMHMVVYIFVFVNFAFGLAILFSWLFLSFF